MTEMIVVSDASHVIELADGAHHSSKLFIPHRQPSRGHQCAIDHDRSPDGQCRADSHRF